MAFSFASIPLNGIIKNRSATVNARTNTYNITFALANDAWALRVQNVNATYLTLRNLSTTLKLYYTYVDTFVANNPTITAFGGTAGISIVALGTSPTYPDIGGPFALYKKAGSAGVFTIDTNWTLVNISDVGYFLEIQQPIQLDALKNIMVGTDTATTTPIRIDEGLII